MTRQQAKFRTIANLRYPEFSCRKSRTTTMRSRLKWYDRWSADACLYKPAQDRSKPKYYVLEMLPYPSGTLHVGHLRNYAIGDALARYKWMRGFNVLHPMGWDAFGLPAENAAHQEQPASPRMDARQYRRHEAPAQSHGLQLRLGPRSFHLRARVLSLESVVLPAMLESGIAYRRKALVNWCPECGTVLANEQVVDGCCWRHETTPVEQRELEQWFLRITAYADELLDDTDRARRRLAGSRARDAAQLDRPLRRSRSRFHAREAPAKRSASSPRASTRSTAPRVSSSRPDIRSSQSCIRRAEAPGQGDDRRPGAIRTTATSRRRACSPATTRSIRSAARRFPIWVGNFVLMGYGTGAIMAVPAHDERDFEFCTKYGIPIRPVIRPSMANWPDAATMTEAFPG